MKVAVDCDLSLGHEVARSLRGWLDEAEAGEMDGDEMDQRLTTMVVTLEEFRLSVRRALGY